MVSDFFRHPPGRYIGYAHVIGQALPSDVVAPVGRVWMTRATLAYIALDTLHKATDKRSPNPVSKGVDALLWQGLASLLLPMFVVRGAVHVSSLVNNGMKIGSPTNRYVSLGFVLLSLPLLGGAVDKGVNWVMDEAVRPILFL